MILKEEENKISKSANNQVSQAQGGQDDTLNDTNSNSNAKGPRMAAPLWMHFSALTIGAVIQGTFRSATNLRYKPAFVGQVRSATKVTLSDCTNR